MLILNVNNNQLIRIRIIVLLLLPFLVQACKINNNQISRLDSEIVDINTFPKEYFITNFKMFPFANNKFIGKDSFMIIKNSDDSIKLKGSFAINSKDEITPLKIGKFHEYYPNGNLKNSGEYEIGRYTQCCAGGLCSQFYNFKIGKWNYYFRKGDKAEIVYEIKEFHIATSCEKGDKIQFGQIDHKKSKYWSIDGNLSKIPDYVEKELETVIYRQGNYHFESLTIEGNEVRLEFLFDEN